MMRLTLARLALGGALLTQGGMALRRFEHGRLCSGRRYERGTL